MRQFVSRKEEEWCVIGREDVGKRKCGGEEEEEEEWIGHEWWEDSLVEE